MKFSNTFYSKSIKAALFFCAMFIVVGLQAAVVTWNGGVDSWHNPGGWDTGNVPSSIDVVIIPGGEVIVEYGYQADAKRIEIGSAAKFTVQHSGEVMISGAEFGAGILNEGECLISGKVRINDVTLATGSTVNANGFQNVGHCEIFNSGQLAITDIHYLGLENNAGATFYNHGEINIENVGTVGIRSHGTFNNYKSIALIVPRLGFSHTYGLQNTGVFRNYAQGDIAVHDGYNGLLNWQNGLFYNYGVINTKAIVKMALRNENRFYNQYGSQISASGGEYGLVNKNRFYNKGIFKIDKVTLAGVLNEDRFYNYKELEIRDGGFGFHSFNLLWNKGVIEIENSVVLAINIEGGDFNNYAESQVFVDHRIQLNSNTEFNNIGFVTSTFNGVNAILNIGGEIYNDGVFNHPFATTNTSSNDELFLGSITGSLQNGVPYPNALDLEKWDKVEFLGVYNDAQKSKEVGEYDAKYNTLIPADEAIGLSQLWFELALDDGDNRLMCRLTLAAPVLPFVFNNQNSTFDVANSRGQTLQVFPNPSAGEINIQSEIFDKGASQIILLNALGQVIHTQQISQYEQPYFNFSSQLNNGTYFLKIYQNDQLKETERVQLIR